MRIPLTLTPDNEGALLASFQNLPEASASGGDLGETLDRARDALLGAIGRRMSDGQPIPDVFDRGGPAIVLPALAMAKIALHNAMVNAGLTNETLAERLDAPAAHVGRLLDLDHGTRLDQLEAAFEALDLSLEVRAIARLT